MGFFHLRATIPPQVGPIWTTYQALDHSQWLKPEEVEHGQIVRLRTLLQHCYDHVPYRRRIMDEAGIPPTSIQSMSDFRKLPLLTRELYRNNFHDLQAREVPKGISSRSKSSFTSGTNGMPIEVRKSNYDGLWWSALYLRDLEWQNFDPRGRLAAIRLIALSKEEMEPALAGLSSKNWRHFCPMLFENGPSFGMDIRQDPRKQLEWLRQIRPNYLLSMPSNLEFLASLVRESGKPLDDLRAIQIVGESLDDDMRRRIEEGFGVPVKNLYSTTETGYIASTCPKGNGLHVHAESVIAEVLDAENRPCAPGQTGRLVVTSLHSFLAPFIRYDILDEVTLADGPCPCGRGLPLWKRVDGRMFPLFHCTDGQRKSTVGIARDARLVGGMHQFQIVQKRADLIIVRVVPDQSWSPQHVEKMKSVVRNDFGQEMRVEVEEKEFLERPPGGKLLLVRSELAQR